MFALYRTLRLLFRKVLYQKKALLTLLSDLNLNYLPYLYLSRLLAENSMLTEPIELPNMKRHSEGTFSNDYSKYLETRRAQDFVQWLKNSKRNG